MEIKTKINKWDLIKLKKLLHSKGKQPTEWEKIFANDATQEGISLQNLQTAYGAQFPKTKLPNQKMGQRTKQTFLQRRHTDG